jgi:Methyltransferase domain
MKPARSALDPPAPDFDRLARLYVWMEAASFGPWLSRTRCAFLDDLSQCRHALVLGDGDGRFTARLLTANEEITVDAVDASPAMLRELVRRTGRHAERVRTDCADIRQWIPGHALPSARSQTIDAQAGCTAYDLVITHFFLDCLTTAEVRALAVMLRSLVSPSAVWLVSEFAEPPNWFGRFVARPLVAFLYGAFGRLTGLAVRTLPDYRAALTESGFWLERRQSWLGGLLESEFWRFAAKERQDERAKQIPELDTRVT